MTRAKPQSITRQPDKVWQICEVSIKASWDRSNGLVNVETYFPTKDHNEAIRFAKGYARVQRFHLRYRHTRSKKLFFVWPYYVDYETYPRGYVRRVYVPAKPTAFKRKVDDCTRKLLNL